MNSQVKNNNLHHVSVELTAEEALALTGVRFNGNPKVEAAARQKVRTAFEKTFDFSHQDKVDYELLK
ncbi:MULTISPECIES: hypothetical protein [Paenibacillus]|jgi:hypothetical protein|uniref:Uncharacterized protein n=1 Tax=Paenibacillus illinoisensis TaxID=59845 RepID=A0A2W0CY58_9BACL|nr:MULTISPECIES: hypothetical protein [Paenibacillus]MBM6384618.1 hypothetical protein [Paenibacillus sp.]MBE7679744.1 hypothetical protein [Paenibacillus sp. P13VS]MBY0218176.1 hypothetical protein [Paenibacillus illinoisensis]MCG7384742.1 hypothetical protein [Paenibacillus sp. ACRRY]MCM3205591.1 hypothetical protein [Paenibacillus illinoisensis]